MVDKGIGACCHALLQVLKDQDATLYQSGLVPAAHVHLGLDAKKGEHQWLRLYRLREASSDRASATYKVQPIQHPSLVGLEPLSFGVLGTCKYAGRGGLLRVFTD
eukprot:scaffold23541_cov19-Tisochrysis_lutea.AAC.2